MLKGSALLAGLAIALLGLLYGGIYEPAFWVPSILLLIAAGAFLTGAGVAGLLPPIPKSPLLAVGLLGVYLAGRSLLGPDPQAQLTLTVIAGAGVAYLMGTALGGGGAAAWIWLAILAGTALIQIAFGLGGSGNSENPAADWPLPWLSEKLRGWYENRSSGRMHGFYLNANHLAWFLNFSAIFCLSMAFWSRSPRAVRVLLILVGVGLIGGSFQTLSRAGLIALFGGLLALALASGLVILGRAGKLRLPLLMIGIALAVVAFLGLRFGLEQIPQYSIRFFQAQQEADYRENVWKAAGRQFQTEPIWGTGPGTFQSFGRSYRNDLTRTDPVFAHNDWLQFAAEYGAVGIGLLMLGLLLHLRSGIRGLRPLAENSAEFPQDTGLALRLGAFAALVAGAIHSGFDFNLHLPANLFLTATCLGCLVAGEVTGPVKGSEKFGDHPFLRAALPLGLATVLGVLIFQWGLPSIRDLQAENALNRGDLRTAREMIRLPGAFNRASPKSWEVRSAIFEQVGNQTFAPALAKPELLTAAALLNQAMERNPRERDHALRLAGLARRLGEPASAETLNVRTMELDPFYSIPYLSEGEIYEALGNRAEASQFYQLALRLPNRDAQAENHLQRLSRPEKGTAP